jgi:fructokinase
MWRFGIDLGGTKIEGCVLDGDGAVRFRERIATEADHGADHILGRVATLYGRMCAAFSDSGHSLGIGTPGSLSPQTGLLRNSNTVSLNGLPLATRLAEALGRPCVIENDANCFALAEALHGAGRGHALVFGVIVGTGCGGGIVWNGAIHRGRNALGGEWGHARIDPAGPACYCGGRGCVETFISGSGLARRHLAATGRGLSAEAIFAAAHAGEPAATDLVERFHDDFGRALANVVNTLDPDVIVLGGGLSNLDSLYDRGVRAIAHHVFGDTFTTPVVRHALGDSAGVIGAALIGAAGPVGP